ncbi:MAG: DUF6783 domain-containing protein [Lachnospiraceae bacterium]
MCTYLYNKINYNIFSYNRQLFAPVRYTRACLKKAFRELRVSVCGRFCPNEGGVAGYAEAFLTVQSDSQTNECYSYFENDVPDAERNCKYEYQ